MMEYKVYFSLERKHLVHVFEMSCILIRRWQWGVRGVSLDKGGVGWTGRQSEQSAG